MLPNVNTDDGDVSEKRILVGCGDDLQFASGRVDALMVTSGQSRHPSQTPGHFGERMDWTRTTQPQPEPWMPAVVVLNSFLSLSTDPQRSQMAAFRGPSLSTPPLPLRSVAEGARFFQKREWLMWPADTHVISDQIVEICNVALGLLTANEKADRLIVDRRNVTECRIFTYHRR